MKKNERYIFFSIIILTIVTLFCFSNISNAADPKEIYRDGDLGSITIGKKTAEQVVSEVLGVVQAVGYACAIIVLTFMGIKYIWSSPDGKAELKKQFIPYFIGMVLLVGGVTLAKTIADVAYNNQ